MFPLDRCPLCGGVVLEPFAMDSWSPLQLHFTQARCAGCRLLISQPQASEKEIDDYYGRVYYEQHWPEPGATWDINTENYRRYELPLMQQLWASEPPATLGRVAEIGCGYGVMLSLLQEQGYQVSGCEMSSKAVRFCRDRGLDVVEGKSPGLPLPRAAFDLVIARHVIEHVTDPSLFVQETVSLAKAGGAVVFVTEDAELSQYTWNRFCARVRGRIPPFRSSTDHTFVFGASHLRKLMENAGCRDIRTRSFSYAGSGESFHWKIYKTILRFLDRMTGHGEFLIAVGWRDSNHS